MDRTKQQQLLDSLRSILRSMDRSLEITRTALEVSRKNLRSAQIERED